VRLFGEGYFEVAKDKAHPFIVATDKQKVEVLGTHFNINSYADEGSVKTTLLEGSVRVDRTGRAAVVLKPNQQSVVSGTKQTDVNTVDVNDVVSWKNGKFVFVREDVRSIMNKIARWYDVQIVYEGDVKGKALGGSVSRFKNVSEVLEMLSATKAVQFRIEGRKVIVMPFKE
jgi:ferric-dicitrate binding protein FerR (iron transport regulator)